MPTTASSGPRFAAFISYRHLPADRRWAQWLLRALEGFNTPTPLVKLGYPARLGRLYRDDDESGADVPLTDQITTALDGSEWLILVWSTQTQGSAWIRRELCHFAVQHSAKRILPLLIDGEPDTVLAYLADALGEEAASLVPMTTDCRPREREPLKHTQRRVALRLAAALLGCRYDDLKQREAERHRQRRRYWAMGVAGALAMLSLGALIWWDRTLRIHVTYYQQMAEIWGAPVGDTEIDRSTAARRRSSYRFTTQGGRVLEVARVNCRGTLTADPQFDHFVDPWVATVARWSYQYYADGLPAQIDHRDERGVLVRRTSLQFLPDRSQAIARFELSFGVAEREPGNVGSVETIFREAESSRSQIGQHRLHFAKKGRLQQRDFEPVGGGPALADAQGAFGRAYGYDRSGRLVSLTATNADGTPLQTVPGVPVSLHATWQHGEIMAVEWRDSGGQPAATSGSVAKVQLIRDEVGNMIDEIFMDGRGQPTLSTRWQYARRHYRYNRDGFLVEARNADAKGQPMLVWGVHLEKFDHDMATGRTVLTRFFDLVGLPASSRRNGCTAIRQRHNTMGWLLHSDCLDSAGRPTPQLGSGAASSAWVYDSLGRAIESLNMDERGLATGGRSGVARGLRSYDDRGQLLRWRAIGSNGQPVIQSETGVSEWRYRYDERGNRIEAAAFGTNGRPTVERTGGWSVQRIEFDSRGQPETTQWFDTESKPTLNTEHGAALRRYEYGGRGALSAVSYFDALGRPTLSKAGYFKVTYQRDAAGRVLQQLYVDTRGRPTTDRSEGVYGLRYRYGPTGVWTRRETLNAEGHPAAAKDDGTVAMIERELDAAGRPLLWRHYDASAQPTRDLDEAVHAVRQSYDALGNEAERTVLDEHLQPMLAKDDSAATQRSLFDPAGNAIETRYFGMRSEPVASQEFGAHAMRRRFDALGREIEWTFFDANNKAIAASDDGAYSVRMRYDTAGEETEKAYFDDKNRPVLSTDEGVAVIRQSRNAQGYLLTKSYFGVRGEPIRHAISGVHAWHYTRDALGRALRLLSVDTDGTPLTDRVSGVAESRRRYDALGREIERQRLDAMGRPASSREDHVARWTYAYDDRGNQVLKVSRGPRGELVVAKGERCAATRVRFDNQDRPAGTSCVKPSGN
jgi:YD repeat-containing protein